MGYVSLGRKSVYVSDEDAYDYALDRCLNGTEEEKEEFKRELVEWFFSGNWVKEK